MAIRKTKGRQKVELVKMKKESNLQVTFSKRRNGLFKKADELSTLTGAEVCVIVFSPGNKAFSFGCPDVKSIIGRYKNQNRQHVSYMDKVVQVHRQNNLEALNTDIVLLKQQLEEEKKRGEILDRINLAEGREPYWWAARIKRLSLEQLEALKAAMEDLQGKVSDDFQELKNLEIQRDPFFQLQNPFAIGSGVPFTAAGVPPSEFEPFDYSRAQEDIHGFCQFPAGPSAFPGGSGGQGGFQCAPASSSSGGGVPAAPEATSFNPGSAFFK